MSNKKNTEQSASSKHILLDPLEDFSLEKNGFSSSNGRHEDYEKCESYPESIPWNEAKRG